MLLGSRRAQICQANSCSPGYKRDGWTEVPLTPVAFLRHGSGREETGENPVRSRHCDGPCTSGARAGVRPSSR